MHCVGARMPKAKTTLITSNSLCYISRFANQYTSFNHKNSHHHRKNSSLHIHKHSSLSFQNHFVKTNTHKLFK